MPPGTNASYFEASAKGANQKFVKRWNGVYTVTKLVGPVNVQLQATPSSKPILVHINRVKHLSPDDFQEYLDSARPKEEASSSKDEPPPTHSLPRARPSKPQRATVHQARRGTPYSLVPGSSWEFQDYIMEVGPQSDFNTTTEDS